MHPFHRRLLAVGAAMPLLQMASFASGPVNSEAQPASTVRVKRIHLRFIKPSDCLARLTQPMGSDKSDGGTLLPTGVDRIETDDISGVITISGTQSAIAKCAEFVGFFDVRHRRVELDVRFLRYSRDATQAPVVVGAGKAIVDSNDTANITTIADHHLLSAELIPHINGDGSTSLKLSLTSRAIETAADGATRMSATRIETSGYRRISTSGAPATSLQSVGLLDAASTTAKSSDWLSTEYTYFIDVNPTVLDNASKQ